MKSSKAAKRKRDEESATQKKGAGGDKSSVGGEPPSKKTKQATKEAEEPRTFATTAEWLESERWGQVEVGDGPDFYSSLTSPNVELWLVKAPAQFDASALEDKVLSVEHFVDLKAGQAASRFTVEVEDKKYVVQAADPGEYKQLIDLVPSTTETRLLLGKPFARGFNIAEAVEAHQASVVPIRPRPIVPQPSNLRLRFRPPGYVLTKKETKEEEKRAKKHAKAVHVAKRSTPPLRPVPISQMDEEEEEAETEGSAPVAEEEEVPLVRRKKKSEKGKSDGKTKKPKKSDATSSTATTPTKKKKKKTKAN